MHGRGYHESHLDMEGVVDVQDKYQLLIRTLPGNRNQCHGYRMHWEADGGQGDTGSRSGCLD